VILDAFEKTWCVDWEFREIPGELPEPVCLVAVEVRSGKQIRLFREEMPSVPPYSIGDDSLYVGYAITADLLCHISLGWKLPRHVLDLYAEYRVLTNSIDKADQRANLLSALAHFRIPHITEAKKDMMRSLAERGGPWTVAEKAALIEYCASDTLPLRDLLLKLAPDFNPSQALERARYSRAVAVMEGNGVPIDTDTLFELRQKWANVKRELISRVDTDYRIFDDIHFSYDYFERWLTDRRIGWPRTPTGRPKIDDETMRDMALVYPGIAPLRQLRATLSSMKLESLAIGHDGRNRISIKPFSSLGGRNQPSTSKFIFGPATWIRYLIKPKPGHAVAYIDYSQQEFAVAAVLSGDSNMQQAYLSSDPYIQFAKQAGAAPANATKETHGAVRDQFKACALALMYGMGAKSLGLRIGKPEAEAQRLIEKHQETYPKFWTWVDKILTQIKIEGSYTTRSGWRVRRTFQRLSEHDKRSLINFPVQAGACDVFRLACCLGIERGIKICCPVHDAVLIEAPVAEIADKVSMMQEAMAEASRVILDGFEIKTAASVFGDGDRYKDVRGESTWRLVRELLGKCQPEQEQYALWA
jgi:hypothetical protein